MIGRFLATYDSIVEQDYWSNNRLASLRLIRKVSLRPEYPSELAAARKRTQFQRIDVKDPRCEPGRIRWPVRRFPPLDPSLSKVGGVVVRMALILRPQGITSVRGFVLISRVLMCRFRFRTSSPVTKRWFVRYVRDIIPGDIRSCRL